MLHIENLTAAIDGNEILRDLNLDIKAGEVHAIMGPNGSGKSTLAHVLGGRDGYDVTGTVTYQGQDLLALSPEERAGAGLFVAFQYPVEIPGVGNLYFLRTALNSIRRQRGLDQIGVTDFLALADKAMESVEMDRSLKNRSVNDGFSGGEKKRNEILQMTMLEPTLAVLDETDSGLDIDAIRIVADGVNAPTSPRPVDAGDHPLRATPQLHRPRPGPRPRRWTDNPIRRQGTGHRTRNQRVHRDRAGGCRSGRG